jgi:DNA invertase Pin-like site-specific DNA recombinase
MVIGYVRVSQADQSAESQKNLISRYLTKQRWHLDEWIEVVASSRKSFEKRRITELLDKVSCQDIVVASELSRLGRSIKEVLGILQQLIQEKGGRLVLIKQGLDLNPSNADDMTNKILLTVFSMLAELEWDFISERTKEGLRVRKALGIKLGKPKGTIQASIYDKDKDRIFHLHALCVPLSTIINQHLGYGKYSSLKQYIDKRKAISPYQ